MGLLANLFNIASDFASVDENGMTATDRRTAKVKEEADSIKRDLMKISTTTNEHTQALLVQACAERTVRLADQPYAAFVAGFSDEDIETIFAPIVAVASDPYSVIYHEDFGEPKPQQVGALIIVALHTLTGSR